MLRLNYRNTETPAPHLLMATRIGKRAYDPRKPQVNSLSAQNSKGLEFRSVIFIGRLLFSDHSSLGTSLPAQNMNLRTTSE